MNATTPADITLFRGETAAELLPLALIQRWPDNPRRTVDAARVVELAESVAQVGVLQPVLVRPQGAMFELVCGERRWRAAQRVGLTHIPAVVRTLTDAQALEIAVTENLQREDVPPLEEAEGYERLMHHHGYSIDDICHKVGKSRTYVYSRVALLRLCEAAREYLRDGKLTPTVALLVARIPVPSQQEEAAKHCAADWRGQPLSAEEARRWITEHYMLQLDDAPFDIADATLCPAAGACTECPKRTGNNPDLFGDVDAARCTDSTCWEGKEAASIARRLETHRAAGGKVISVDDIESRVKARSEVVFSNEHVHDDPARRTWTELLADQRIKPVLWYDVGNNTIREVYESKAATKIARKLGIGPAKGEEADEEEAPPPTPEERRENYERTRAVHLTLWQALIGTWPRVVGPEEIRAHVVDNLEYHGGEEWIMEYARLVLKEDPPSHDHAMEVVHAHATTTDTAGLYRLLVAIALYESQNATLEACATAAGLDADAITRAALDALEAERAAEKPAEPPAKKKRRKGADAIAPPADKPPTRVATEAEWPFPVKRD